MHRRQATKKGPLRGGCGFNGEGARLQEIDDTEVDNHILYSACLLVNGLGLHAQAQLHTLLAELECKLLARQVAPFQLANILQPENGILLWSKAVPEECKQACILIKDNQHAWLQGSHTSRGPGHTSEASIRLDLRRSCVCARKMISFAFESGKFHP